MSDFFANLGKESTQTVAGPPEASCELTRVSVKRGWGGDEGITATNPPLTPDVLPVTKQVVSQTPNGVEILFQAEPKRLYKVRCPDDFTESHGIDPEWVEVPSVTQILDCLNKQGLPWWGMKVGVEGVKTLFEEKADFSLSTHTSEDIVKLLTEHKLTVNHIRDKAGDRGIVVHDALEKWAETGVIPDPEFYSEAERGYVKGLSSFLTESKIEPVKAEVMVGSPLHKYAGRYDLLAYYGGEEVCTHTTPSGRGSKREVLEPGLFLFDLKTSKNVYPETHFRQLAAYKQASIECGYETPDECAVVQVCEDGRYQVKVSTATFQDFQCVYDVYKSNQRLK